MTYKVKLINFEGPLDLLLQLVEQSKMSATELSLSDLTEQYIEHVRTIESADPAEISQFAALAAKLLHLKSRALFMNEVINQEIDEELAELGQQLAEYSRYRQAADQIQQLWASPQQAFSRQQPAELPDGIQPAASNLTLQLVTASYHRALQRQSAPVVNLPAKVDLNQIRKRLENYSASQDNPHLEDFFQQLDSRMEVAVAFVAALELWSQGKLRLEQSGSSTFIRVEAA